MTRVAMDVLAEGHTWLHRRDARIKVLVVVAYCAAVATTPRLASPALAGLALLPLAGLAAARVSPVALLRRVAIATPFILLVCVWAPFYEPGRVVAAFDVFQWRIEITWEGLVLAITLLLKIVLAVAAVLALAATTPFARLVTATRKLGLPRMLAMALAMTYRYLFVVGREARRLGRAAAARSGGRRTGLRTAGAILNTLFGRSLDRSERVHRAMLSRLFDGDLPSLVAWRLTAADALLATLASIWIGAGWWAARALVGSH